MGGGGWWRGERGRERERWREEREGGGRAREGRERVLCGVACRAATLVLVLLLEPLLLLLLLEGCAMKRRCAWYGPSEPLLHPEERPSLACNVCTCIYYVDIDYVCSWTISYIGCYMYCQSGNRVVSYILSGDLFPHIIKTQQPTQTNTMPFIRHSQKEEKKKKPSRPAKHLTPS